MAEDENLPVVSRVEVLGRGVMMVGTLFCVAYLAVRWLVLAHGGGYDLYGFWLFHPDKAAMAISTAVLAIFFGLLLVIIGRQLKRLYEMGQELQNYYQPIGEEK